MDKQGTKTAAVNRKAGHDYFIEARYEAGIELCGTEVKSIPLSVYFKHSRVKVEVGLCRGKKLYDKRESAARRDASREMDRAIKSRNR